MHDELGQRLPSAGSALIDVVLPLGTQCSAQEASPALGGLSGMVTGAAVVTLRRIRHRVAALHPGQHPLLRPDRMPRLELVTAEAHGKL